ncbi:MAG: leucine-rich repeat domain-containing protein [Clostridia bacterium]|nr:leucine-rich repeat domain-containing protein [Clostridia bacterium]
MSKKIRMLCRLCLTTVVLLCIAMLAVACTKTQTKDTPTKDDSVFGDWITQKEASCEEDGLKYRTNGKGERQEEAIPALGHSYGEWKVVTAATSLEEGVQESVCSRCHEKQQKPVPVLVDGTAGLEYTYWESQDMYYITGAGDAVNVKDLVIPTLYKGKTVIYVYKDSLNDMPNLETVKFAGNSQFTYIYPNAFKGCEKLKTVEIPASVTYLPYDFAPKCDALESVTVDSENETYCSVNGVVYTKDMPQLVYYPSAKIGVYTLPASLTSITYKDVFKATNYPLSIAKGITAFAVEDGNSKYTVDSRGALYSSDMKTLYAYPIANKQEEYTICNDSFKTVEAYAFANNKYLNTVKILGENTYKDIKGYSFYITNIQSLEFSGVSNIREYAIYHNPSLQNIVFNAGGTSSCTLYNYAIIDNTALKKVVLPSSLNSDLPHSSLCMLDPFWGCTSLMEIAIESGDSAFTSVDGALYDKDMQHLLFFPHGKTTLTLPSTLKTITTTTLKNNESLKFDVVDGVKYYQNWVVGTTDDEISTVIVREGTVGIAQRALRGLKLSKLSLPASLKYLSPTALADTSTTEFTYHSNFEYIDYMAFSSFGYAGGSIDLGTPSFIGNTALGYTKVDEIKVGFKNNGNMTVLDGTSTSGAFFQSKAKRVLYGPYIESIGKSACKNMTELTEVYIANQALCDDPYSTFFDYKTYGKSKRTMCLWIASNITLSETAVKVLTGALWGYALVDGATTTVDGITYVKYATATA